MKTQTSTLRSGLGVFLTAIALVLSAPAFAQETTSSIRGKVLSATGQAMTNASIVVEDLRTGTRRSFSTNEVGTFLASQLPVGGPYKVTVNGSKSVTVQSVSLGDIYNLTISMDGNAPIEEVVVYGESQALVDVASGPAAT